jgi:hypothetical protein
VPDRKEASDGAARQPAPTASPAVNKVPRPPAARPGTGGTTQKTPNSFQVARQNVERCKEEDPDQHLQAFSLAKQLADYLEARKSAGEPVHALQNWEIFWVSDFIEALRNGRSFGDLEDCVDMSQVGAFSKQICNVSRLLQRFGRLMNVVDIYREHDRTKRLQESDYRSYYWDRRDRSVFE